MRGSTAQVVTAVSTCLGCGCTDVQACPEGCAWLRVDETARLGVCSECPHLVVDWDRIEKESKTRPEWLGKLNQLSRRERADRKESA